MFNIDDLQHPLRQAEGAVFLLPGIEGQSVIHARMARGLDEAGVPYSIEVFDWPKKILYCPILPYNLRSKMCHGLKAQALVQAILKYQERWPNRPVYLIGHSGGAALVLDALERLPRDHSVSGAVLLAAAMSPRYPLNEALRHVHRKIWSFTSWGDWLLLGVMTTVLGTYDGRHSPSAGMVGFRCDSLDREELEHYEHRPYRLRYLADMHYSGHFGCVTKRFARHQIAPLILGCNSAAPEMTDERTVELLERQKSRDMKWNPGVSRTA